MIAIDRSTKLLPEGLLARAEKETERLVMEAASRHGQQRLEFRSRLWMEFIPALREISAGKCAYCESLLDVSSSGAIDRFRPKGSVAEDSQHPGYFWLAFEWRNLLLACAVCNLNKRNQFPISGPRALLPTDSLEAENPSLVDPCSDAPDQHLVISPEDGFARARTARGEASIQILGLNRAPLVEARRRAAEDTRVQIQLLGRASNPQLLLDRLLSPTQSYLAVRRELIAQFRQETTRPRPGRRPGETRRTRARAKIPTADKVSVAPPQAIAPHTGYIRRIVIQNFRSLEHVDLEFDYARDGHCGWQVFLGENGVGKSSILQAIAIALIGQQNLTSTGLAPTSVLRVPYQTRAPASGSIEVWLDTDPKPLTVTFDRGGFRYEAGAEGARSFVRGYGPTRLLPPRTAGDPAAGETSPGGDGLRRVGNLFNPFVPLCDASRWLRTLTQQQFDKVALTLKDVLRFGNDDNLVFDRDSGVVTACDESGIPLSLDLLSHGQQSALVLATDIVYGIMASRSQDKLDPLPGDFRECAGIILLDEIDAHLHPRWKMEIVSSLKRAFPNIQFLATTHEPLCLRGLDEREIIIVRRQEGTVVAEVSPVSPQGWRVDQLLTSDLFGLFTTIDPAMDVQFQEYYELLGAQEMGVLSESQGARLAQLRQFVRRHNRLGYTRRDQLLYEVIDEFLAKELRLKTLAEKLDLREQTKQRLRDIWENVAAGGSPEPSSPP